MATYIPGLVAPYLSSKNITPVSDLAGIQIIQDNLLISRSLIQLHVQFFFCHKKVILTGSRMRTWISLEAIISLPESEFPLLYTGGTLMLGKIEGRRKRG